MTKVGIPNDATSSTNGPCERNPTDGFTTALSKWRRMFQSISSAPPSRSPQGAMINTLIGLIRLDPVEESLGDGSPSELGFEKRPPLRSRSGAPVSVTREEPSPACKRLRVPYFDELQPGAEKHGVG
jgi:hypothetical protein